MFEDRSVPNTDENISKAIQMADKFDTMSQGCDVLSPLLHIYKMGQPADCLMTHIFLYTASDVHNINEVCSLVAQQANYNHRLHVFGIGSEANEQFVKSSAIYGQGNYHMTLNGEDLADKVISTIFWDKSDYTILREVRLFDKKDNQIPSNLAEKVFPLRNGGLITLVDLIDSKEQVYKLSFEIYDLNSKQTFKSTAKIQQVQSNSITVKTVQNKITTLIKEKQDKDFYNWQKHEEDPRRYTYEDAQTVSKSLNQKLDNNIIILSILNQVYHRKNTAMVAHKKFIVNSPLENAT